MTNDQVAIYLRFPFQLRLYGSHIGEYFQTKQLFLYFIPDRYSNPFTKCYFQVTK